LNDRSDEVEAFIEEYGTPFHSFTFLATVGSNYKCLVYKTPKQGMLSVLPLVATAKFKLSAYHIPPYAYQFGPVVHPEHADTYVEIVQALLDELPSSAHYDFKMCLDEQNIIPFRSRGFSISVGQTHVFSKDSIYGISSLTKDKKRYINKLLKALEEGKIQVEENKTENLDVIRKLQEDTAERLEFAAHKKTLESMLHSDVSAYTNVVRDADGRPLSGTYCPYDQRTMYYLISANVRVEDSLLSRSNMISLYQAVLYANKNQLNFDFEGSNIPGVARFYRRMGGTPTIVYRAQRTKSMYYQLLRFIKQFRAERAGK